MASHLRLSILVQTYVQAGKLGEGLELLMSLERQCRVGNDYANLKEVILTVTRLCRKAEDWAQLNTSLTLISKRRGQHSKAVTAMVQEVNGEAMLDSTTRVIPEE